MKRLRLSVILFFAAVIFTGCATAKPNEGGISKQADPMNRAFLRMNTDMHQAMINRISIDAKERYLLTGSTDKTMKMWNIASGKLIRTFRFPISDGNEGRINAVALSPDGRFAAAGGWTGQDFNESVSVYIFDISSGAMVRRIPGLPSSVHHLVYSPDGAILAIGLGSTYGIRLVETTSGNEVFSDAHYGGKCDSLIFSPKGGLVSASSDGNIRMYDAQYKLVKQMQGEGGRKPYSLSFTQDGLIFAAGYSDSTRIDCYSKEGEYLYSPDTKNLTGGNLSAVSFSSQGRLYAGGSYGKVGSPILIWENNGKGSRKEIAAAENTIMQIWCCIKHCIILIQSVVCDRPACVSYDI